MKKIATILIFTGMVLSSTVTFAQTQAELEAQYVNLLYQLLEQLQKQLMEEQNNTLFILPNNQICDFRYQASSEIIDVQKELKNQGYTITKVDGISGPETKSVIMAFEADQGLEQDGVVDEKMQLILMQKSLLCLGDNGVTQAEDNSSESESESESAQRMCKINYQGSSDTKLIQKELKNQGYIITKVDGISGPETKSAIMSFEADNELPQDGVVDEEMRTELSRKSVMCDVGSLDVQDSTLIIDQDNVENNNEEVSDEVENIIAEKGSLFNKQKIATEIRSTASGIPDSIGVFTYQIIVELDQEPYVYIPTRSSTAFSSNIFLNDNLIDVTSIDSITSSGGIVTSLDGNGYFKLEDSDSVSLRSSIQPGPGSYKAQLARLAYTYDDVALVNVPSIINFGFDSEEWQTDIAVLAN